MSGALEAALTHRARGVDVAFDVPAGATLALTGPNGSGKSSVLALLAGLLTPDVGSIRLGGRTLVDTATRTWVPAHRRRIVLMSQDSLLFGHLSVLENVAFGPRALGHRDARDRADAWLERVGVSDLGRRRASELSGGQARRVALARALAAEPEVILLDEPFTGLDRARLADMRALVAESTRHVTTILVSHDPDDLSSVADLHLGLSG